MSELQQAGDDRIITPRETMRNAYWARVGRVFWRGIMARIAFVWIALVFVLTLLAPFMANGLPYTVVVNGHREWPLFRYLTREDLIWVVWGVSAILYWIVHRITRGSDKGLSYVRIVRAKWLIGLGSICVIATVLLAVFWHDFLDDGHYKTLASSGKLQHAVYAPLRWGYADREPLESDMLNKAPSGVHWFGTDRDGRDVLARLVWGARIVFEIGLVSEIIALIIGSAYGALMGYFVGKVDILGMRFLEMFESIPLLFLLMTFIAAFGRNLFMLMVIIGVVSWTGIARFVRAEFLRIRQMDYVVAARGLGLPLHSILFRHMLPNSLTPVIVTFTFGVAANIVSESILSFLGIGVEPPTASWGAMLYDAGNPGETFYWWQAFGPGLMIFFTVFAINILGEAFRDAIDPRTNKVE